jgi:hypothetical protein
MRGNASLARTISAIPNRISVHTIRPTLGLIRNEPLELPLELELDELLEAAAISRSLDIYLST